MKKCVQCGAEFEPKNPKGKFCSDKCRVYFNRKNKLSPMQIFNATEAMKAIRDYAFDAEKIYHELPSKPKNLLELKLLCPKELTGFDKSNWIANERQKYGI